MATSTTIRSMVATSMMTKAVRLNVIGYVDKATSGAFSLTAPAGCTALIWAWGGGGGGGAGSLGTGGTGGGAVFKRVENIGANEVITGIVGAGGVSVSFGVGNDGQATIVKLPGGQTLAANPGLAGNNSGTATQPNGIGGLYGDLTRMGGASGPTSTDGQPGQNGGAAGVHFSAYSGGGGAAGFSDMTSGIPAGAGGNGGSGGINANPGGTPGGGGGGGEGGSGGSGPSAGGAGGTGQVIILLIAGTT